MVELATELRPKLEERLSTLTRREAALQKHLRGEDGRRDADSADKVGFNEQDEVLEGLEDEALREIPLIKAAIGRIDKGEYGVCTSCGETIAEKRLRAIPYAPMCVDCARQAEA